MPNLTNNNTSNSQHLNKLQDLTRNSNLMNQNNSSSNESMLSILKSLEQNVKALQVLVILAMCLIVFLLLLNMCLNRYYALRITRYINAHFGFNQFDRQILM